MARGKTKPSRGSRGGRTRHSNRKTSRFSAMGAGLGRLNPRSQDSLFPPRLVVPALVAAVSVALGMAALRIDLIRTRYEIGMNYSSERNLNREIAGLTARMRELRDPLRLSQRAKALGFVPPQQVIDLPPPVSDDDPSSAALEFARNGANELDQP